MKFLLIGNGFIAPKHIEAIKETGGDVVESFGLEKGENYWKEAIKKTEADCIVILTPNNLHFEMAKFAAEKNKIVLCEKPLTIKSEEAEELSKYSDIFTVLQLRYHHLTEKIKKEQLRKNIKHQIKMNIFFKRDDGNYIKGWKNQKEKSGGFLFNLGIHYFDILLYLFGEPKRIKVKKIYEKNGYKPEAEALGKIEGENYSCDWQIFINRKDNQGQIIKKREFIINGKSYNFSSKDNLAEENLHKFVYQDLLKKKELV